MNRRGFLKGLAVGTTAVAAAPAVVLATHRTPKPPMVPLQSGDILTQEFMAELVDRVNELESRA